MKFVVVLLAKATCSVQTKSAEDLPWHFALAEWLFANRNPSHNLQRSAHQYEQSDTVLVLHEKLVSDEGLPF